MMPINGQSERRQSEKSQASAQEIALEICLRSQQLFKGRAKIGEFAASKKRFDNTEGATNIQPFAEGDPPASGIVH